MSDQWRRLPLGAVARLEIAREAVEPIRDYPTAGVYNAGQGLFGREPLTGSDTNYPALHRLRAGQVVMRKLTAWEGSVGVVPPALDGAFVSPEFPTFTLDKRQLLPEYMAVICEQPWLWNAMKDRSTGSVQRRKRVSPTQFLQIEVDVPPVPEQMHIVRIVEHARDVERAAAGLAVHLAVVEESLFARLLRQQPTGTETLGDVSEVIGGGTPKTSQPAYWGGPVLWVTPTEVTAHDGDVISETARTLTESGLAKSGARLVPAGTVLVTSRATIGSVAIAGAELTTNQGFASLVPGPRVNNRYLMAWCRANRSEFRVRAGGSTFPEISRSRVKEIPLHLPGLDEQVRVAALVDALGRQAAAVHRKHAAAKGVRRALSDVLTRGVRRPAAAADEVGAA